MRFAVISKSGEFVENVIVAQESQKTEMETALGRTLLDASVLGLTTGDYYNGSAWTRNVDGEQVVLPLEAAESADAAEAIAILSGEVD